MICRIIENRTESENVRTLRIDAPEAAAEAEPGQFVHIKVPNDRSRILRRPMSISGAENRTISVSFQIRGEGTRLLSEVKPDGSIDFLGPLGKGFPVFENKRIALIGGGTGIFPLLFLKERIPASSRLDCYIGFKDKGCSLFTDNFSSSSGNLCVSTEDGSLCNEGLITDYFRENAALYDIVYSCGPVAMLSEIKKICEKENIKLFISLEERMGCGIGACLVCACRIKNEGGGFEYKHVCKDGPVFDSREVIL